MFEATRISLGRNGEVSIDGQPIKWLRWRSFDRREVTIGFDDRVEIHATADVLDSMRGWDAYFVDVTTGDDRDVGAFARSG